MVLTIKMSFLSLVYTSEPAVFIILSFDSLLCQNVFPNLNLYDLKMYDLIFPQFYIKTPGRCTFVFLRLVELCQGTYFSVFQNFNIKNTFKWLNFIRVSVPKECDSWLKWSNPIFCFIFVCLCLYLHTRVGLGFPHLPSFRSKLWKCYLKFSG